MTSLSQRIQNFTAVTPKARALTQNDNDVVIVAAVRSAITKVRVPVALKGAEGGRKRIRRQTATCAVTMSGTHG